MIIMTLVVTDLIRRRRRWRRRVLSIGALRDRGSRTHGGSRILLVKNSSE